MRSIALVLLLAFLGGCADQTPTLAPPPGPDDPAAPTANAAYRPVMAGTVYHAVGGKP